MRKLLSCILAVVLAIGCALPGAAAKVYADEEPLTRREMAKIVAGLLNIPFEASMAENYAFEDVLPGSDGYEEIILCCYQGIIGGFSNTVYGPDQSVTRAQIALVLCRTIGLDESSAVYNPLPDDVSSMNDDNRWYFQFMCAALQHGFMSVDENNCFNPFETVYASDIDLDAVRAMMPHEVVWGDFTFDTTSGTITGYTGSDSILTIPAEIEGVPVVKIDHLGEQDSIEQVVIPASVTALGHNAFGLCWNLESYSVDVQNTAFSAVDGVLFSKDGSTLIRFPRARSGSYTVPAGVSQIADHAFHDVMYLTSVLLLSGVTEIGVQSFMDCNAITEITLPDTLISIKKRAFEGCDSLSDVYFIGTETVWDEIQINEGNDCLLDAQIHYETFLELPLTRREMAKLAAGLLNEPYEPYMAEGFDFVDVSPDSDGYEAIILCCYQHIMAPYTTMETFRPEIVLSRAEVATVLCQAAEINVIGASFDSVPPDVSDGEWYYPYVCTALQRGFMSLDENGCFNPTQQAYASDIDLSVVRAAIPGHFTFDAASGTITGYKGNDSVITIPAEIDGVPVTRIAHLGMQSTITQIVIPASVTEIETNAFGLCGSLESFQVDPQNPVFGVKEGVLFSKDGGILIRFPRAKSGSYTVPDGVYQIADHAFHDALGLTSITLPAGVTTINADAFNSCVSLTEITLPNTLRIIRDSFTYCNVLGDVYFMGSETAWNKISMDKEYNWLLNATIHYDPSIPDSEPVHGDANGDNNVNMQDRIVLSRYLAKWPGYSQWSAFEGEMDVNGDNKVNAKDRMILSRYLANWGAPYNSYFE